MGVAQPVDVAFGSHKLAFRRAAGADGFAKFDLTWRPTFAAWVSTAIKELKEERWHLVIVIAIVIDISIWTACCTHRYTFHSAR